MTERFTGVYEYDGPPRVDHEGHIYYNPDVLRDSYDIDPVPDEDALDVLVSGGSMGGLFTAHALQQSGHDVDVYERTAAGEMKGRGAGIVPDPELLEYMERYDLADRGQVSVYVDRYEYLDHDGSVRAHRTYPTWSTSWDTFYRTLRAAVGEENYHMDHEVTDVVQDGESATATFDDGRTATGDLLVAAEGYKSRTREQFLPDASEEYAGYIAWRGIVPERDLPADLADYLDETYVLYHGPDFVVLAFPVPGANGETEKGGRRINLVWYENAPAGDRLDDLLVDRNGVQRRGSVPPGLLRDDVRERQVEVANETVPEPLARFIEAIDDLYIQCIYDISVPRMVFDRVALLGDGAFFVRPHIGAGTAKAAADGFSLAEALCHHGDLEDALATWEDAQLELGERLVALARERGDRYLNRR